MHHLSVGDRFLFLTAVALGVLGGSLGVYLLVPLSLLVLYVALSLSQACRHHELSFFFPLSVISCLPVNLKLAWAIADLSSALYMYRNHTFVFMIFFLLVLISAEELILGAIGTVIWGNQKAIFYQDEKRNTTKINGTYIQEITEGDEYYPTD